MIVPAEPFAPLPAAPRVAVVILNWNGIADTRAAVRSVLAQTYPNVVTIVADNGSASDEAGALRREFQDEDGADKSVVVVKNGENLGFCGGNNRGAEHARRLGAHYLLFLNNDATLAPDAAGRLVAAMEADPTIGAASPQIFHAHAPNESWFGSGALRLDHPLLAYPSPKLGGPAGPGGTTSAAGTVTETLWACGCAFLIRTDMFFGLNGFDEQLFAYHEDVDLSLRLKRAGLRCVVLPGARAWHVGSASTGGAFSRAHLYLTTRNGWHLVRRHASVWQRARYALRFWPRTLTLLHALLLWDGAAGAPVRAGALWQGLKDGRRGVTGPVPAGVREQTPAARAAWERRRGVSRLIAALLPGPHRWLRRRLAGGYLPPLSKVPMAAAAAGEGRAA